VTALLERDLSGLDLKVLLLDGVHYSREHVIVAAIAIDGEGKKHVLVLWEGATENKVTCTALLESLLERGLCTDRATLVVMDGGKALYRAVRAVFGKHALIQRCQEHKKRNVLDALPQHKRCVGEAGAERRVSYRRSRPREAHAGEPSPQLPSCWGLSGDGQAHRRAAQARREAEWHHL
jgi:transposase-like protein